MSEERAPYGNESPATDPTEQLRVLVTRVLDNPDVRAALIGAIRTKQVQPGFPRADLVQALREFARSPVDSVPRAYARSLFTEAGVSWE